MIITKDKDFLRLLERHGRLPQIVWMTCGNVRNAKLHEIVLAAWPRVVKLLRDGERLVEIGHRTQRLYQASLAGDTYARNRDTLDQKISCLTPSAISTNPAATPRHSKTVKWETAK